MARVSVYLRKDAHACVTVKSSLLVAELKYRAVSNAAASLEDTPSVVLSSALHVRYSFEGDAQR